MTSIELPAVGVGAVVSFTTKDGDRARAIHTSCDDWDYTTSKETSEGVDDHNLVSLCDADGFTVELEGLQ